VLGPGRRASGCMKNYSWRRWIAGNGGARVCLALLDEEGDEGRSSQIAICRRLWVAAAPGESEPIEKV
jgi:hypothetical protein